MKKVLDVFNTDISEIVSRAAKEAGIDEILLLATMKSEGGLNPNAERWGDYQNTKIAKEAISRGDFATVEKCINASKTKSVYDISFGDMQQIIDYHYFGDRTASVENVLAVRDHVFNNRYENILEGAKRLANNLNRAKSESDGTNLAALIIYNGGSDYRSDAAMSKLYAGNIATYTMNLNWAEQFREYKIDITLTPEFERNNALDVIWGYSNEAATLKTQVEQLAYIISDMNEKLSLMNAELKDAVAIIKRVDGI